MRSWRSSWRSRGRSSVRAFEHKCRIRKRLLDDGFAEFGIFIFRLFGEDGWGAKASEVLLRVRGKDFRHEKTKNKRGTYKGGSVTLASNSIKFDNSDDE